MNKKNFFLYLTMLGLFLASCQKQETMVTKAALDEKPVVIATETGSTFIYVESTKIPLPSVQMPIQNPSIANRKPSATPQQPEATATPYVLQAEQMVNVMPSELSISYLTGQTTLAKNLLSTFQATQRQPDKVGFATNYFLPNQMNAYKTMFQTDVCYIAIDGNERYDTDKVMHFALIETTGPFADIKPPFIAYIGDLGPLSDFPMAIDPKSNTAVGAPKGAGFETVVVDVPSRCFSQYIHDNGQTAHVKVYILNQQETYDYLQLLASPS